MKISLGTNILYKIRREELAKGSSKVCSLARAFESTHNLNKNAASLSIDKVKRKGFFSMRKSRSVDTDVQKTMANKVDFFKIKLFLHLF